ncbi:MAG: hypothetical protein QNJ16_09875 [Rhodobacter sp.]|nr:hypothetical protein [Rhodobacter sp.]
MRATFAALITALWPALAGAQPVPAQSGEHAGFSRVVFLYGDVPDWTFGRVAGGYELRVARRDTGYDLSKVFDFIPRARLANLELRDQGRVFFDVVCECHADAFEIRTGVVVDIKDGPAPPRSRYEARLDDDPVARAEDAPPDRPDTPGPSPLDSFQFTPLRTVYAWTDQLTVDLTARELPSPETRDSTASPAIAGPDPIAQAQASLLAQLARASTQGLVIADLPESPAATLGPAAETAAETSDAAPTPPPSQGEGPGVASNIRIETAVDQGQTQSAPGHSDITADGADCFDPSRLDLASWGPTPNNGASLASFRTQLIGEFDAAEPESITGLARAYIYLTFGAEAKALLHAFPTETPDAALLRALADIMDHGVAQEPGLFQGQLVCDSRVALWALLARPALSPSEMPATEAVLSAFSELPLHLRRHLGPDVAQRFLQIGDAESASTVRNMIAQAPGQHGPGFDMLEAELALSTKQNDVAEDRLAQIAKTSGPRGPKALVRLIDARLAKGGAVSDAEFETVQALAFENRGSDIGAELTRAALRATIHRQAFSEAAAGLAQAAASEDLDPEALLALRRELFAHLTERAEDVEFLRIVLSGPSALGAQDEDAVIRRAVARRLLDLGLPGPARDLLGETEAVPTQEDRLLFSEAYLSDARTDLSIGYLAGLSSPTALRLRARAHERASDFGQAAIVYGRLKDAPARDAALWRDGSWDAIDGNLPDVQQRSAALAAASLATSAEAWRDPSQPDGPLARNRALLRHSREAGTVISDLLAGLPQP